MKPESLSKMRKLRKEARQRLLERGKIEFRVEPDLMAALLDLATARKAPLGPMVRQWVKERLDLEAKNPQPPQTQLDKIEQKLDKLLSRHDKGS